MTSADFDAMEKTIGDSLQIFKPIYSNGWDGFTLEYPHGEDQADHGGIVFYYSGADLSGNMTDADANGSITSSNLDFFGLTRPQVMLMVMERQI